MKEIYADAAIELSSWGVAGMVLIGACYTLMALGRWWGSTLALVVMGLNIAGVSGVIWRRYRQAERSRLGERRREIEQTLERIHNGPLQNLAIVLRKIREPEATLEQIYIELEGLDQELRAVYETVREESMRESRRLHLSRERELDLQSPTNRSLYEVYEYTLRRQFPCFRTLKFKFIEFEAIDESGLTVAEKSGLCRFLEEALCNVGKHAVGVTQLEVVCKPEQGQNVIRVIDNGSGIETASEAAGAHPRRRRTKGRGGQQGRELARRLGGHFRRLPNRPQGTICELRWPSRKPWLRFS